MRYGSLHRNILAEEHNMSATPYPLMKRDPLPKLALTISEFCETHGISEAFYYRLQREGHGPRTMRVGGRRLISLEEAARWRQQTTHPAT
jgi:predicted DNA-binding transcriptional regulator AlpA